MGKDVDITSLIGETLTHIDTDGDSEIMLTTASGRIIKIHHYQDCCEHVRIEDTQGNWHDLVGKVIVEADHKEDRPDTDEYESFTNTTLTFRVDDATVISKWIGDSNGYYSESVDIEELKSLSKES